MNDTFYELIQVALGVRPCLSRTPNGAEWGELYKIAKKQSLVGICFAGVQRLVNKQQELPEMLYLTWMGMAAKIQQRNEVMNQRCVELLKRLNADGLHACVLKGQGMASIYGELQGLRQSGDIDVLVDAPIQDVIRYVKGHCPDVKSLMSHHIDFPIWEDTMVEMHFLPAQLCNPFTQRKLVEWYESEKSRIFNHRQKLSSGDEVVTPDVMFNLVYILLHIYKHLFAEGIGLRQLMDYYFILMSCELSEEEFGYKEVENNIRKLGMQKFAGAVMWVLAEVCSLPKESMICKPNREEGKWLLEDIMRNGNMGHGREDWIKLDDSAWFRFRKMLVANVRLLCHYPGETLWFPYFKLWHYPWRKYMERKLQ